MSYTDTPQDLRDWNAQRKEKEKSRTEQRVKKILGLNSDRVRVAYLRPGIYIVNDRLEVFPKTNKWYNLTTGKRGSGDLVRCINEQLPSIMQVEDWCEYVKEQCLNSQAGA